MQVDFHYVPTSGDLSGKSFEEQTERAFNELGSDIENINTSVQEAINTANAAQAIAENANQTAQQANQNVQDTMTMAQQTEQTAQESSQMAQNALVRANEAYDTAVDAAASAADALTIAGDATQTAQDALQQTTIIGDFANNAQILAQGVALQVEQANGVFSVITEDIDADEYYDQAVKLFVTSPDALHFPIAKPLYFQTNINNAKNSVVQFVWPGSAAQVNNSLNMFSRVGSITQNYTSGTETLSFSATSFNNTVINGSFLLSVTEHELDASFIPGAFEVLFRRGASVEGVITFALTEFSDGKISINGEDVVSVTESVATITGKFIIGTYCTLGLTSVAYSESAIAIYVTLNWLETEEPTLTYSNWLSMGNDAYTFGQAVADAGGYAKGAVLISDNPANPLRFRSLKDDNTDNFNTDPSVIGTSWGIENQGAFLWNAGLYCTPASIAPPDMPGVSLVVGSNAKLYQATAISGPGTAAGPQDPVTSTGYWLDIKKSLGRSEQLTADTTYYLSPAGNDANDGLSPSDAWATIEHAVEFINNRLDLCGHTVSLQIADGVYGDSQEYLIFNNPTSGSIIINGQSVSGTIIRKAMWVTRCSVSFDMLTINTSNYTKAHHGVVAATEGIASFGYVDIVIHSSLTTYVLYASLASQIHITRGNVNIRGTGKANCIIYATNHSTFFSDSNVTINVVGPITIELHTVRSYNCSVVIFQGGTLTGNVTGSRYSVANNSLIATSGRGANFIPGSTAGVVDSSSGYQ